MTLIALAINDSLYLKDLFRSKDKKVEPDADFSRIFCAPARQEHVLGISHDSRYRDPFLSATIRSCLHYEMGIVDKKSVPNLVFNDLPLWTSSRLEGAPWRRRITGCW